MKKFIFLLSVLLFGLSANFNLCQAQEEFFSEEEDKVVTTDNSNPENNSYEDQIKKLEKEKADLQKLNNSLRTQADQRAELENKLAEKDRQNEKLRQIAEANKAEADSAYKELYAFKMKTSSFGVSAENFVPTQENPVPVDSAKVDPVKKDSVKTKPAITTTRVIATKTKNTTFVSKDGKGRTVPQIKKGTILLLEEKGDYSSKTKIARVRKSDIDAKKGEIEKLLKLGYTLEEVLK